MRPTGILFGVGLARGDDASLQQQLYDQLRAAVLAGGIRAGTRLPATRSLARELGCARNTVIAAFERLAAEGYTISRRGAGTFIADVLPDDLPRAAGDLPRRRAGRGVQVALSTRGEALAQIMPEGRERFAPFVPSVPDATAFPFDVWARLTASVWREPSQTLATFFDPRGYGPLREAIAAHLRAVRMVVCTPEQVIITSGTQQGVDMSARLLLDAGDEAWVEDPGYPGTRAALLAAGIKPVPVPVDGEGLVVEEGLRRAPNARMAVVSPSHQYPLGCSMSLSRRLELLSFAGRAGAFVLEDDYDSEFRYAGRPLASLQGIDAGRQVVYAGTFSKVMFPSLRIGFLVVPRALAARFARARAALDVQAPIFLQPVLAAFLNEGHLATHVRRMRVTYAARQNVLMSALRREMPGLLTVEPQDTGLHLLARINPQAGMSDREASRSAAAHGITAPPLSHYLATGTDGGALLLGFGATPQAGIPQAVRRLAAALRRPDEDAGSQPRGTSGHPPSDIGRDT